MIRFFTKMLFATALFGATASFAQNINYSAHINQFRGYETSCNDDGGWLDEEFTWKGYLSDNVNTGETYSNCQTKDCNGGCSKYGTFASRSQSNTAATQLNMRIDAWEDDNGSRCSFYTDWTVNNDDCRLQTTSNVAFAAPVEYTDKTVNGDCGNGNYRLYATSTYRYATTALATSVESPTGISFTTGGNRAFWGSRGSWGYSSSNCATSGTINHNQTSSFSTTVECKSSVTFRWKVSSQLNADYLRIYVNGVEKAKISGSTSWASKTIALDFGSNTVEWRYTKNGSTVSGEDRGWVDNVTFTDATTMSGGTIAGAQSICVGNAPSTLTSTALASAYSSRINYVWEQSTNGTSWGKVLGATATTYTPPAALSQTTYYRRRATDLCSNVANSNVVLVTVQTSSTAPTINALSSYSCPGSSITLSASGGVNGTGATIEWYKGSVIAANHIGTGASVLVNPNATTTYYARREGACNNSTADNEAASVYTYAYSSASNVNINQYCEGTSGWYHFYNGSDEIIFSLKGDLSQLTSLSVDVKKSASYLEEQEGVLSPTLCSSGYTPKEQRFEMGRNWNVNYTGSLVGTYDVRYYFEPAEKAAVINAAANHMAMYPDCGYSYKYPTVDGFYWFKNTSGAFTPGTYDGLHLTAAGGTTTNGLTYTEMTGLTSFSGGTGAVIIVPLPTLPVEWLAFTGKAMNGFNQLNWATATEKDNSHFEIQRSSDGNANFETIGTLKGNGTVYSENSYTFKDNTPLAGVNYYRVKQVDLDGNTSYTNTIAINVAAENLKEVFYPNPTNAVLTYQFEATRVEQLSIQVIDLLGQVVLESTYQTQLGINSSRLNVKALQVGTYFVRVMNEEGTIVTTAQIIKQN